MWLNLKQWFKQRDYAWKFKLIVCLPIFSGLTLFDWIAKWVVVGKMDQNQSVEFIPGFLRFNFKINPGAAYGMNSGNPALAISLATIVTVLLILAFLIVNDKKWLIGLSFLVAGSFANLLARAWAPGVYDPDKGAIIYGGVVDFLQWDFSFLDSSDYIFNLADAWVTLGIVALIVALIIEIVCLFKPKKNLVTEDEKKDQSSKEQ